MSTSTAEVSTANDSGAAADHRPPVQRHFDDITAILVGAAPRQRATQVLELLVNRTGAHAGAVYSLRDDRCVVFVTSRDLEAESVARACTAWTKQRGALDSGAVLTRDDHVIAPVLEAGAVVALVYLEAPTAFDARAMRPFEITFVKAIRADRVPFPVDAVDGASTPAQDRERLLMLLERNEWNISRVARAQGVTRRTVYLRMQRYGIPRKKVPKSNKPIPL